MIYDIEEVESVEQSAYAQDNEQDPFHAGLFIGRQRLPPSSFWQTRKNSLFGDWLRSLIDSFYRVGNLLECILC